MNRESTSKETTAVIYSIYYFIAILLIYVLFTGVALLFEDVILKKIIGLFLAVSSAATIYTLNIKYFNKTHIQNTLKLKLYVLLVNVVIVLSIVLW